MIISWSGGTLDDYAAYLTAEQQSERDAPAPPLPTYKYPHGSRYPFDELLAATQLGPDGVMRKWMLCFVFAISFVLVSMVDPCRTVLGFVLGLLLLLLVTLKSLKLWRKVLRSPTQILISSRL